MPNMSLSLQQKVEQGILALGGDPQVLEARGLPCYADARELVVADTSKSGIEHRLTGAAADSWKAMKAAAANDNVSLILISGFRSFERQFEIVNRRIEAGASLEELFCVLAPPGCSQHHTGRALDIGTMGCEPASINFATTAAFQWLCENASPFGFSLSYPQNNSQGYSYEPWHWFISDA